VSTLKTELSWEYHQSRLLLRVGDRQLLVPRPVAALVLGRAGHGLSDDPSIDLLQLQQDLRCYGRFLDEEVAEAAARVTYGCKFLVFAHAEAGRTGRRDRRLACEYLAAAAALHGARTTEQHRVRSWNSQVRQFVIDAGAPHSLLAEAAAGWHRPEKPELVLVSGTSSR
jgi:hypothetical protein